MRLRMSMRHWTPAQRLVTIALLPIAVVLAVLLVVSIAGTVSTPGSLATTGGGFARVDRPAPSVTLPSLTGSGTIGLPELAGKPIVINFWASSCDICASEARALVQVAQDTRGRVRFLGIDTLDLRGPALAFAARYRIPYQLSFDPLGVVSARYRLPGLPMTFFLSPSGKRILGVNTGALTVRSLTAILRQLYGVTA
jgi:thiol-disulfide isomerase/thioredoxin